MVQHLMRQHEKYQTICDYTPTISHDMSVTHDIKRCETPMLKLQEIIAYGILAVRTTPAVCPRIALQFSKEKCKCGGANNTGRMPENFPYGKFSEEKITALTYVGAVFSIYFRAVLWYNLVNGYTMTQEAGICWIFGCLRSGRIFLF